MFEDTHLQTSSRVAQLFDPIKTAKKMLIENDTSFCEGYDQPGVDMVTLAGMSQDYQSFIHEDFDYKYLENEEGCSAKNSRRKMRFN